jgi:transporter family-2 protein
VAGPIPAKDGDVTQAPAPHTNEKPEAVSLREGTLPMWLAVVLAVASGALTALQTRVNGELGHRIGDGFSAAAISFGSGLVILCLAMLLWPAGRRGLALLADAARTRRITWWYLLGGLAGAFFVLSQSLTAAGLGIALFTVAIVAGQTISGLVMDRLGVGPGGRRPLTPARIAGAFLVLLAVAWAVAGQFAGNVPLWLLWMPLAAGAGQGWQQAVNGRVRAASHSALTATFLNFVTGATALGVALVVHGLAVGWPSALPTEAWLYVGGAVGALFIAGSALVVRTTGVLVLGLSMVAGQLVGALVLDLSVPSAAHPLTGSTLVGAALALAAVVVASLRPRAAAR